MVHSADMGRGVIGVVDVSSIMDDENGDVLVLNNKQGFRDCEAYAKLLDWLGNKADEYWDENFDALDLRGGNGKSVPDHEWVQCNKCCKWRILSRDFDIRSLPQEWFCYMPPFHGNCEIPEQNVDCGVITLSAKRSHSGIQEANNQSARQYRHNRQKKSVGFGGQLSKNTTATAHEKGNMWCSRPSTNHVNNAGGYDRWNSRMTNEENFQPKGRRKMLPRT